MPITVGKHSVDLWSLDTNLLSEILRSRTGFRPFFVPRSVSVGAALCVSPFAVLEIRRRPDLYAEFLQVFSVVPLGLLRTPMELVEAEVEGYPNCGAVPVHGFFSFAAEDEGWRDPEAFFEKLFSDPIVQDAERRWIEIWRRSSLDSMLGLKKNFPAPHGGYSSRDAVRFVDLAVEQNVARSHPDWMRRTLERDGTFEPSAFPTLRSVLHTVFYRFYLERREPEIQDVFDILIHGVAPYVDLSLTEGFQADIFKKMAACDPSLSHVRGVSLREVRAWNKVKGDI